VRDESEGMRGEWEKKYRMGNERRKKEQKMGRKRVDSVDPSRRH
jgi:hypothetical protein